MRMSVNIPEKLHYVLERGDFESRRAISSIAFMLDKHVDDPEWLDSAEFHTLVENAVDRTLYTYVYSVGTLGVLLGENDVPTHYLYNREYSCCTYIEE